MSRRINANHAVIWKIKDKPSRCQRDITPKEAKELVEILEDSAKKMETTFDWSPQVFEETKD